MAQPTRRRKDGKHGKQGGARENAVRTSLVKRTFRFSPEASAAIDREAERLTEQEGRPVSAAAAADALVRLGDAIATSKSVTSAWARIGKVSKVPKARRP